MFAGTMGLLGINKMKHHLVVGIEGLEYRLNQRAGYKYGSWRILQEDTGRFLTKVEVRAEIDRCRKLGFKVIPTCENIDATGHCKGHNN
jgi:hypothetical protein